MLTGFLIIFACAVSGILGTGTQTFLALPGQMLLALTALVGALRLKPSQDWKALLPIALAFLYLILRAHWSSVPYLAQTDFFLALGGLIALGLGFGGGQNRPFRFGFYAGLLVLVLLNIGVGLYHLRDPDFSIIPGYARAFPGARIGGLYTNPNHLCSFVALTLPLLAGWILINRGRPVRRVLSFVLVAAWIGIGLLSYSRAGLIGLGISVVFFFVFLARGGVKPIVIRLPWWALALLAAVVSVALVLFIQLVNKRSDELMDTLSQRQQMASTAFSQMQESPILGTGAGSFQYLGNVYRSSRWKAHVQDTEADFAHNDWIQLAAEYGVAGLILALAATAWFFWRVWVWLSEREKSGTARPRIIFVAAVASGIAGLLVHSFFDFNLHVWSHVCIASLLMGMAVSVTGSAEPRTRTDASAMSPHRWGFAVALMVAGLFQLAHWNVLRAEFHAAQGMRAEQRGNFTLANTLLGRSLELAPDNGHFLTRRASNYLTMAYRYASVPTVKRSYEAKALADLERLSEVNPRGFHGWLHQGLILAEMGRYDAAANKFETALKLAPFHRVAHFGYASFLFSRAVANGDREGVLDAQTHLSGLFARFGSTPEGLALAEMMKEYLKATPQR